MMRFWNTMPSTAITAATANRTALSAKRPSMSPSAAYVDTRMPGMRPMFDSSRNVRMFMSVRGTR